MKMVGRGEKGKKRKEERRPRENNEKVKWRENRNGKARRGRKEGCVRKTEHREAKEKEKGEKKK